MKTYKNIYPKICAYENLYESWRRAARGKRRSPEVAAFEYHLIDNLLQLEEELRDQTYRPGPYRHFYIYQPKRRRISAAPFRDRIVHHALVGQIEPIFEARFCRDSYACRRGKGTHAALDRCQGFARRYLYVLQCDLVQFFPSIDHAILRDILFRQIASERVRLPDPITHLRAADVELDKLRFYLRLSADLGYISLEQQRHAGQMIAEIGRMLGSWQKKGLKTIRS